MYAIVDIAGQQFRVEKDQKIFVHRLEGEPGALVDFDKVLLIQNDESVTIGTPVIEGAMVYAVIIDHQKGDKVLVFKKKKRKGYRIKNGHSQQFTQILIEDIIEKGAKARVSPKAQVTAKPARVKKTTGPAVAEPAVIEEVKTAVEKTDTKIDEKKEVKKKAVVQETEGAGETKKAVKKVSSKAAAQKGEAYKADEKKVTKSATRSKTVEKKAPAKTGASKKTGSK